MKIVMKNKYRLLAFMILSIPTLSSLSCFAKGSSLDVPEKQKVLTLQEAAIFYANVAARIKQEYVQDVPHEKLLEGALNGMLSSLDPHSAYLSPEKLKFIRDSVKGEYGGLGMEVQPKNGLILIVTPVDDTPAERAGLKPGDLIIMVDGEPVLNQDLAEVVKKMQGKPGTKITLTIRRGEKSPFDVTLSRAIIKIKAVKWKIIEDVGYIRITSFINKNTKNEVLNAIKKTQQKLGKNLKGFVIDLRNNAGGLLEQAVDVTDIFIKSGEVVSIKGRNEKETKIFKTGDDEDFTKGVPLVLLINEGSASAAEIMAGALQDYGRAVIVGTQSFGKGSVQVILPMINGGALKMTTSLYYTPLGRSIQKEGIQPDIVISQLVDMKKIRSRSIREKDLYRALKNGSPKDTSKKEEISKKEEDMSSFIDEFLPLDKEDEKNLKERKNPLLTSDFQLSRAVDILKGMSIYGHSIIEKPRHKRALAKTS